MINKIKSNSEINSSDFIPLVMVEYPKFEDNFGYNMTEYDGVVFRFIDPNTGCELQI